MQLLLGLLFADELLDKLSCIHTVRSFSKEEKLYAGPVVKAPAPTTYENYLTHNDEKMIGDSPVAFGLHPNAEIEFRTDQANHLFKTTGLLPSSDSTGDDGDDGAAKNPQMIADALVQDISEDTGN